MDKFYEATIKTHGKEEKIQSYELDKLTGILKDKGETFLEGVKASLLGRLNEDNEEVIIYRERHKNRNYFIKDLFMCKDGPEGPIYLKLYSVRMTVTETKEIQFDETKGTSIQNFRTCEEELEWYDMINKEEIK